MRRAANLTDWFDKKNDELHGAFTLSKKKRGKNLVKDLILIKIKLRPFRMKISHIWNWNLTRRNDIAWFYFLFSPPCLRVRAARNGEHGCSVFTLLENIEISPSSPQHPRLEMNSETSSRFTPLHLQPSAHDNIPVKSTTIPFLKG